LSENLVIRLNCRGGCNVVFRSTFVRGAQLCSVSSSIMYILIALEVNELKSQSNGQRVMVSKCNKMLDVCCYVCSYGIELCGCACKSNIVIMQRSQSKILRAIANVPGYIKNHTLHTDCNITYVSDVIHESITKHHNTLEAHPKPLLEPLLQPINTSRLKRCWPLDLQGT
jgi:hypothetical protein